MGGTFETLAIDEVIEINRQMVNRFGGSFFEGDRNLANSGSLEHVLQEIQSSYFGHDPYPNIIEKAAILCWRIIARHVFHDGNKRTGMETCRLFLELNGRVMRMDFEVVDMAVRIAANKIEFSEFVSWLEQRTTEA